MSTFFHVAFVFVMSIFLFISLQIRQVNKHLWGERESVKEHHGILLTFMKSRRMVFSLDGMKVAGEIYKLTLKSCMRVCLLVWLVLLYKTVTRCPLIAKCGKLKSVWQRCLQLCWLTTRARSPLKRWGVLTPRNRGEWPTVSSLLHVPLNPPSTWLPSTVVLLAVFSKSSQFCFRAAVCCLHAGCCLLLVLHGAQ